MLDSEVIGMTRKKAMTMGLVLILVGLVTYATLASSTETEVDFIDAVEQGLIAFHISDIQDLV